MKSMRENITKPRKVALYKSLEHDWFMVDEVQFTEFAEDYSPLPAGQFRERPRASYVRVSEMIDVTFSELADDAVVQKAVEALNEAERQAISELNKKLIAIREQKAQLLALSHQPTEAA